MCDIVRHLLSLLLPEPLLTNSTFLQKGGQKELFDIESKVGTGGIGIHGRMSCRRKKYHCRERPLRLIFPATRLRGRGMNREKKKSGGEL
jgi:hypothetical protein